MSARDMDGEMRAGMRPPGGPDAVENGKPLADFCKHFEVILAMVHEEKWE